MCDYGFLCVGFDFVSCWYRLSVLFWFFVFVMVFVLVSDLLNIFVVGGVGGWFV